MAKLPNFCENLFISHEFVCFFLFAFLSCLTIKSSHMPDHTYKHLICGTCANKETTRKVCKKKNKRTQQTFFALLFTFVIVKIDSFINSHVFGE